jgi:hypothetical protein
MKDICNLHGKTRKKLTAFFYERCYALLRISAVILSFATCQAMQVQSSFNVSRGFLSKPQVNASFPA